MIQAQANALAQAIKERQERDRLQPMKFPMLKDEDRSPAWGKDQDQEGPEEGTRTPEEVEAAIQRLRDKINQLNN